VIIANIIQVLLELAYRPPTTNIMRMASEIGGWKTIQGLETLVTQGMWQFELWTGVRVRGVADGLCRGVVLGAGA
jgi:shikimate 5-dehydrogenase